MISKKEFYFIRHGQTDYNLSPTKEDHGDIPLNETGKKQAVEASSIVKKLPLQTICCSPLKRVKQTKELLLPDQAYREIDDLKECTAAVWREMASLGVEAFSKGSVALKEFLERAKRGLNQALEQTGPVLVVAHGGIHWATCYWMNITHHSWVIDNCLPVHFSICPHTSEWRAQKLL